MTTTTEFKFCALKEWNGDFTGLGNDAGFTTPGNNMVAADGLYMIYVDLLGKAVVVEPAKIYGMGDAFGGWNEASYAFTNGQTATITTTAAGNLRMYAAEPAGVTAADWWQMEFNIFDGKIEYRAGGNDQAAVPVNAGQTVTLDFNAGTGSIQ
jgi:hypothetical protein